MADRISISVNNHVADVVLDRAEKKNAVDIRMFEALVEAADAIAVDRQVRAVVLRGAGDSFCAGIDLGIFGDPELDVHALLEKPQSPSPANLFQRAAYAWRELEVPVIAALQGVVYGAGFQIAMGADIRFAASNTRFSIMESHWGIIPDMAISATTRHILRPDQVKELAWTARVFDVDEALRLGLITNIADDSLAAATALATDCAARSPEAVRGIKNLVNSGWSGSEADSLRLEATLQAKILGSRNQNEAVRANLEKRTPEFDD